eukprot:5083786-Pyramimonas_sp.AAC.1
MTLPSPGQGRGGARPCSCPGTCATVRSHPITASSPGQGASTTPPSGTFLAGSPHLGGNGHLARSEGRAHPSVVP